MIEKRRPGSSSFFLLFALLTSQEVLFLRYTWNLYYYFDDQSNFTNFTAPFYHVNSEQSTFSITICPHVSPAMPEQWRNLSHLQQKLLRCVAKHRAYRPNCTRQAPFAVISHDAIARDVLDSTNFNPNLIDQLSLLFAEENCNYVIFNLYAGTWPSYIDRVDFDLRRSILVKASLSKSSIAFRSDGHEDISLPLFLPNHPFRGRFSAASKNRHAAKYFLTFKGKRYLNGAGIKPRNELYKLHDERSGILMLTTCKHGRDWKLLEDERCSVDNRNYDAFDYADLIENTTFCLVPRGRRLATYRFLEVLQHGCIPVVVADQWVLPFSQVIEWHRAAIVVEEDKLLQIPLILRNISTLKQLEMREFGRFIYEAYFSSIESIVWTAIEILSERTRLGSLRKPAIVWNRWPGGLLVDIANYSRNLADFPFYYRSAFSVGVTPIVKVNHQRDCGLKTGAVVQQAADFLAKLAKSIVVVDNRCRLFDRGSSLLLIDAGLYLKKSHLTKGAAILLVDPFWLQHAEEPESIFDRLVFANFKANPTAISAVSLRRYRFSGGILQDSVLGVTNCSGSVVLPDLARSAVVFHRYYLHLYVTTISKAIRDQASRIGNCEYLLFTAQVAYATLSQRPFSSLNADAEDAGTILCSCLKLIIDQFGFMPLLTS